MSSTWLRFSIGLMAIAFCAARSPACSCTYSVHASKCADLKPIGSSFVGTVIDIENPPNEQNRFDQTGLSRYRFRIDENISGFEGKEVDVYSGRGGGDCSYHFRKGESYFVAPFQATAGYASLFGAQPGKWMAGVCSDTQPTSTATALLAKLRARQKTGATIVGVLRTDPGTNDYNHLTADATVELRGSKTTLSTQTDDRGVYQFYGVPPDTYQFTVKLSKDFQTEGTEGAVFPSLTIADRACYEKNLFASQPLPPRNP